LICKIVQNYIALSGSDMSDLGCFYSRSMLLKAKRKRLKTIEILIINSIKRSFEKNILKAIKNLQSQIEK
jgi:hypothetical protein